MRTRPEPQEPPALGNGTRVLVDRLWPRGVGKDAAALDPWLKDIAPSGRALRPETSR